MATDTICDLITTLIGQDGLGRKRARDQLVEIVAAAVPSLLPLLSNKQGYARCMLAGSGCRPAEDGEYLQDLRGELPVERITCTASWRKHRPLSVMLWRPCRSSHSDDPSKESKSE